MEWRTEADSYTEKRTFVQIMLYAFAFTALCVCIILLTYRHLSTPPKDFPLDTEIEIKEGLSKKQIAHLLEEQKVVRSAFLLTYVLNTTFDDAFAKAGIYIFAEPQSTQKIAETLTQGDRNAAYEKITFPEGFSSKNFSMFLPNNLREESVANTVSLYEGYLFPDTYFLPKQATIDELIAMMRNNFESKLAQYEDTIERSEFTREEVVTLASLVEREAKDAESKKIVAGILLNRLEIGMPLQVDAVFDYLLDKESAELTVTDLDIDSPYNTYRYAGLPPGPIANPGLESIDAVLNPTTTAYMYYLTSPDGTFYYAETFDEHVENKRRYLR